MTSGRSAGPAGRRAFTLVEIVISSLILAVAMTLTLHVIGWIAVERMNVERRQCAVQEAANLMERLASTPWERLNAARAGELALSETARSALPGAELSISIDEAPGDVPARRLAIRLRWRSRSGTFERPVRLSAWAFNPGSRRP